MIVALSVLLGIIICGFFICAFAGLLQSSRDSRAEDYGAPEGALDIHHIQIPNASGSKLGVRASFQSSGGG